MEQLRQTNLECSVLFMQQEHARTLKDLHDEIQKLQKRCSELTFQLAMETTSTSQEDFYREKSEQLERDVGDKTKQLSSLEEELEEKNQRIRFIEDQLKAQDMKFRNDMRAKDARIKDLSKELDKKASLIAALNHKIMTRSRDASHSQEFHDDRSDDERVSSGSGGSPRTPVPPSESSHTRQVRRHTRVKTSPPSQFLQGTVIPRPPSGRKLPVNPLLQDPLPDPTPFLLHRESSGASSDSVRQSNLVPLPPIGKQSPPFNKSNSVNNMTVGFIKKKFRQNRHREVSPTGECSSPEVEVLAIDQLKSCDAKQPRKTDCN